MEIEILQFIAGIGWRRFSISSQFVEGCTSWNPTRLHSDGRKLHGREFLVSQSLYLHFKQSSAVNSNKSFCDVIKRLRTMKSQIGFPMDSHDEKRRSAAIWAKNRRLCDFNPKAYRVAQTTNFLVNLINCMTLKFTPRCCQCSRRRIIYYCSPIIIVVALILSRESLLRSR